MTDLESNKKTLQYYWGHAKQYPFYLWGMLIAYPLSLLTQNFLPALITADILDRLAAGDFVKNDLWGSFGSEILLAVGIGALGTIVLFRITIYFNWKLEANVIRSIDREVFDHLMNLSANFHANHFGGSLVSQHKKLAGAYPRLADTTLFHTIGLLWSLVFASVLLWKSATMFVILLVILSFSYIAVSIVATKKVRYHNKREADAGNSLMGQVADSITNVLAIKSYAAIPRENKRISNSTNLWKKELLGLMWATLKVQYLFSFIFVVISATAIILAVSSVVNWNANVATVFLVFTYTMMIRERLWHFSGQALRNYNRSFGDAQAMTEILRIEPGVKDPENPEKLKISEGRITFSDMDFTHDESSDDEVLFKNFNLDIKPSEKIGLVGRSGSGKTTLTKLLLRFNDLDGGQILVDGQDISKITQHELRKNIAYVPQEPMLFHRSISENIAYGKPDATIEEIRSAAKKAYASEFIDKLPKGYDTLVGERGVKLSGGQRQRIAIARTILKDAPILLLDEATSALDSESERYIQNALWQLMEGRTAIVIAHRLSTIQQMDMIVVMDDGKIIEQGTHNELLKKKGIYAMLWKHQSGGFLEE